MIENIINDSQTIKFLQNHFPHYHQSTDPYEKIAIYNEEEIIGVISYSIIYERAEINYIAVLENQRNKGIASKLLKYAINDIEKSGCQTISLEVNINNTPAINLYLKFGFTKETIRNNYYQNQDAYLMIRKVR